MRANRKIYIKIVLSTHMRETTLDREVEMFFHCYLGKIRTMDKVRKTNISER
jgi:hypothetical protein